ncbi:hypothetical protein ISCGN_008011 [Ixodes scapularis]
MPQAMPQAALPLVDATGPGLCSTASPMPQAAFPLVDVAGPSSSRDRIDTVFYTEEECVEREQRADDRKASLADQSATSRKFELLDVCMESDDTYRGTEYVIVDMTVLQELFASTACGKCGMATVGLPKCTERQYGLAVKLVLTCSSCDFAESRFFSPRVAGEAKITPFEINLMGCILELYTGLVLDHVVLSRYCRGCQGALDPDDDSYGDWVINHKCMKNIDCNAGRMETEAALILFRRSLAKNGLRYTTILSDGDSRTFHALTQDSVYGYLDIEKKDCLNHVHKRMGAALRTLVEKKKAQGESLGGKGKLTQDKIKKITNYFGYAFRSHKHDVPGMERAVQATLLHMTSTDEAPDHSHCPEGDSSWCSYNRAPANHEEPPPHKNPLPGFVRTALEPVFERLGDRALLKRCSDGMTQNAIECLHSVIWGQNSKNTHDSLLSVERAVAEAVSRFNQGMAKTSEAVAAQLGYSTGSCLIRRSLEKDRRRLRKANKAHSESEKVKKRMAKRHKPAKTQDYSPGLL